MRLICESPEIALLGSVKDLAQAALLAPGSDNSPKLPGLGDKDGVYILTKPSRRSAGRGVGLLATASEPCPPSTTI